MSDYDPVEDEPDPGNYDDGEGFVEGEEPAEEEDDDAG